MRSWLVVSLLACAEPRRAPSIVPMAPNAICPSSTDAIGRVRYTCSSHEVFDSLIEPTPVRALGSQLVTEARANQLEPTMRTIEVEGADEAIVIEYTRPPERTDRGVRVFGRTLHLLATAPADPKRRLLQCEVPPVDGEEALASLERACIQTVQRLLQQPAPKDHGLGAECERAMNRLPTLPGRPESAAETDDVRAEMRDFAKRCNDQIAACALAATTYVEATLCR